MDINKITNRTIFRILAMISAFLILALLVHRAERPLIWLASAFFLALALNPGVEWLARFMPRRSRGLASGVVFAVAIFLIVFTALTLVPSLISQTQSLVRDIPGLLEAIRSSNSPVGQIIDRYNLLPQIMNFEQQLSHQLSGVGGSIFNVARSFFSSVVALLTTLVLTFFMLVEGPDWAKVFWASQPEGKRQHRRQLADKMYLAMTGYVTGNLLTSLIAAIVSAVVMAIVGLPFAIPLGILVGVFDLIPLVGATLGSVVVILIALFHSLTAGVVMLVFFVLYQQLENHVLQPLVYSRTVKMSPLAVLISGIIGATLGGLVGALVAIPIAASLQILIKDYYYRYRNDKPKA